MNKVSKFIYDINELTSARFPLQNDVILVITGHYVTSEKMERNIYYIYKCLDLLANDGDGKKGVWLCNYFLLKIQYVNLTSSSLFHKFVSSFLFKKNIYIFKHLI